MHIKNKFNNYRLYFQNSFFLQKRISPARCAGLIRSPRRTVIEQVLGGLGPYLGLEVVDSRPEGPFNVEVNVTGYKWGYCL